MHQVFLSSTAKDLAAFREAAHVAISGLDGFHCLRMEDFGARDAEADDFCQARIAECQLAVFLVGLCYGSSPTGSDRSYTEREYQAAQAAGIPRLVFLSAEGVYYPGYFRESDERWERQQGFRQRLGDERLRDSFSAPDELGAQVAQALANWAKQMPSPAKNGPRVVVTGSGTAATGPRAVAAGAGGIAIGGSVHGNVTQPVTNIKQTGPEPPGTVDEPALRRAYLNRVLNQCAHLFLAGVDPGMQDQDTPLSLSAVYTSLMTREPKEKEEGPGGYLRDVPESAERHSSALEQLNRHPRLVLLGDPGSGKSTLVHFLALCLAGEALADPEANLQRLTRPLPDDQGEEGPEPQPWEHGTLLPLVVVLRDFAASGLPADAGHLWDFVVSQLAEAGLKDYAPRLRKTLLEQGGLLLFDGLDEVPEAERRREQVIRAVEGFATGHPACRVLVTCRTYAYRNQDWRLREFTQAVLAPFGDGQIRRFIRRWYGQAAALGRFAAEDAKGRARLLEQAVFHRRRLLGLARRPLLLTLIASLHAWRGGNLPDKRERLYADTVELLLDHWERRVLRHTREGAPKLLQPSLSEWLRTDQDQVRRVLEDLAFEVHAAQPELTGTADIAEDTLAGRLLRLGCGGNPGQLVEYLRDRAGLLIGRGVGVYTFPHRSFQEYLAACHLTGESWPDELADLTRRDPDRWREVALLAGAKTARGTAAAIWQLADALCYRTADHSQAGPEDAWGAQIAAQALVETADLTQVSDANQDKLERIRGWLLELIGSDRLPARERALAGDSLARIGDPRFDSNHWYLPAEPMLGFLEVPEGPFLMGADDDEPLFLKNSPRHSLGLPGYFMARWPVTVDQYRTFVEESGYGDAHPYSREGPGNRPVAAVSWHDALAYCRWLGERLAALARERLTDAAALSSRQKTFWTGLADGSLGLGLPSEAEWEKAARGSDGRAYPWGPKANPERANYRDEAGIGSTSAVGCFPAGASPYDCQDMSGNVWEWTRSIKGAYPYPQEAPERGKREDLFASDRRVLRGGSFYDLSWYCRCAYRHDDPPDLRDDLIGFRVVVSPFPLPDDASGR